MNNKVKGYLLGAVAAASYGTNPLFRYMPKASVPTRYCFSVIFLHFLYWHSCLNGVGTLSVSLVPTSCH